MTYFSDVLKNQTDSMDRKEKDFATWSFKLAAAAGEAKFAHEHKIDGPSKSKMELSSVPVPGLEDFKGSFEFDRTKMIKTMSSDMHNHNGTKANAALKWTWTLANNKHVINTTKKLETADLGGAKAFVKTEIDMTHESGKDQTFDVKGNLVLSGDEWKAGVSGEMLQKVNKLEALATYGCCTEGNFWATAAAEFPQAAHNKIALGA